MPNLVIACPVCLQKIRAPENVIGRQIKCPQCKNGFVAADPSTPSATVAASRESEDVELTPTADPLGLGDDDSAKPDGRSGQGNSLLDYVLFRRMITPVIITALFYFGVVVLLILGLVTGIRGIATILDKQIAYGAVLLIGALVGTAIWLLMWRILCEIIILSFQILAKLRDIHDELKK